MKKCFLLACLIIAAMQGWSQKKAEPDTSKAQKEINSTIKLGNCTLKFGGFVKLDIIQDFKPIKQTDQFDISTIPTDGSTGTNFRIHARQTRFNFDFHAPVFDKQMRIFAEIDLWGDNYSYTPRLRHAYASWGPVLAGQTWSTFVDEHAMPNTIDFESPSSFPNLRVPQLRLTARPNERLEFSFAFEEATHKIVVPANISGKEKKLTPGFAARTVYTKPKGHVQLGVMYGFVQYEPDSSDKLNANAWGVSLSGKASIGKKDALTGSATIGDGVGMYRGGATTVTVNSLYDMTALRVLGIMASYDRYWCDKVSSTVSYGFLNAFYEGNTPQTPSRNHHIMRLLTCCGGFWANTDMAALNIFSEIVKPPMKLWGMRTACKQHSNLFYHKSNV